VSALLAEIPRPIDFRLGRANVAAEPPEARGSGRDDVRLMIVGCGRGEIVDARFRDLPTLLLPGDVLVVNTSRTLPAALDARGPDGRALALHLSTPMPRVLDERIWIVELRLRDAGASVPFWRGRPGDTLELAAAGRAKLVARYASRSRLWIAELDLPEALGDYLDRHGKPIRYRHVERDWPLDYYQTVYGTEPGSAEMPSAGRAFTAELIARTLARGIGIAPVVLHAGVSSREHDEPPHPERYRVPAETAALVNASRARGGRVIAVGTTVVRALETAARPDGSLEEAAGWTDVLVTPEQGVRAVDGLLTGWHEPRSSHLLMLEAIAGRHLAERSYCEAIERGYRWHEFGDLELILP